MKNLKTKEQLTKTILMYADTISPQKGLLPEKNTLKQSPSCHEKRCKFFQRKYQNLISNLKSYGKMIQSKIQTEMQKNDQYYAAIQAMVEKNKIQSQNFLKTKADQVLLCLEEKTAQIEMKLSSLTHHPIDFQNQFLQYQQIKVLSVPFFQVKEIEKNSTIKLPLQPSSTNINAEDDLICEEEIKCTKAQNNKYLITDVIVEESEEDSNIYNNLF